MNRVLGVIEGSGPGPLNILLGGIHGNESAGIKAINQVFQEIKTHKVQVKGTLIGIAGNLQALLKNQRFIDYDLNRCWLDEKVAQIYRKEQRAQAEDIELFALHELIISYRNKHKRGEKIIMDLHTTSSEKGNFVVIPQNEARHPIVRALKQPVVVDLHQYLKGTMLRYFQDRGFLAFAFEGGMIGTQEAIELHAAGIWELLQASGSITTNTEKSSLSQSVILEEYARNLPHFIKVLYHHWIEDDDGFVMQPGYENFQAVTKGEIVAHDKHGAVQAPVNGMMFLPLYQNAGNDGFFIVEEIPVMEHT